MATPLKPWESGPNFASEFNPNINVLEGGGDVPIPLANAVQPPPLPSRPPRPISTVPSFYPQQYPSFMMGGSPFSNYGSPFQRRLYSQDYDSGMMQSCEESCQALFGPADSVVRSITSVAMLLDSTLQAMQYSFRTVLQAADGLSKLKNVILQLLTSVTAFKIIKSFIRRILAFLGLVRGQSLESVEKEWSSALASAAGQAAQTGGQSSSSPWPAVVFFSLMMGAPYLMFRLANPQLPANSTSIKWKPTTKDSVTIVALYDFEASSRNELSMKKGDRLLMKRGYQQNGWCIVNNGVDSGFVPYNRLGQPHNSGLRRRMEQSELNM